jgi:hypothetical protein
MGGTPRATGETTLAMDCALLMRICLHWQTLYYETLDAARQTPGKEMIFFFAGTDYLY